MKSPPTPLEPLRDELDAFLATISRTNPSSPAFDEVAKDFITHITRCLQGSADQPDPYVAAYLQRAEARARTRDIPAIIGNIDAAIREVELRPAGGGPDWRLKAAARRRPQ